MNGARQFRVLVCDMASKLARCDCETLRFIYGLPERDSETSESGLQILRSLYRQGVYSDAQGLSDLLRTIHREDLANEVEAYDYSSAIRAPSHAAASSSSSSSSSSAGDISTAGELRIRCDASATLASSLMEELCNIRGEIPDSETTPLASLEGISRELTGVEEGLQTLITRCEAMKNYAELAYIDRRPEHERTATTRCRSSPRLIPSTRLRTNNSSSFSSLPPARERLREEHDGVKIYTTHHISGSPRCEGLSIHYYTEVKHSRWSSSPMIDHSTYDDLDHTEKSTSSDKTKSSPQRRRVQAFNERSKSVDLDESSCFMDPSKPEVCSLTDSGYSGSVNHLLSEWRFRD